VRDVRSLSREPARWLIPVGLFLGTFVLLALTSSDYGLSWDEPAYFRASDLEVQWLADFGSNLFHGRVAESLRNDVVMKAWRSNPNDVPHPPFSRILSGLSKVLFSPFLDKFTAYRLSSALFFALLVMTLYLWMAEVFDRMTGLFSAFTLLVMPNLFGYAHFAMTDMPLTAMWLLTVFCFWKGLQRWTWSLALGVVWGLALATKFPALLIPIPLLLWAHLFHRRSYHNNAFAMVFLSPVVMVICQPYLWHRTLPRLSLFVFDSVSRSIRPETNFAVFFFNTQYDSAAAPWYYPFFMTAVSVPEAVLILAVIGAGAMFRLKPQRAVLALLLISAAFVLCMGLFPGGVLHDVNRLMLPALPFLAGLAGCGFFVLVRYLAERCHQIEALQAVRHLRAKLVGVIFLLALVPPMLELLVYHPYELSFYNRLVGGIRGAYQRGLEVTYMMEALSPEFLAFLNRELPANAVINASFSNFMFRYYQEENRLRPDIRITDESGYDYYVLLNRQGTFSKADRAVLAARPSRYVSWGFAGVPLILMFDNRQSP